MYCEVGKQSKGRIRFLAVKSNWEPTCVAGIQLYPELFQASGVGKNPRIKL